MKTGAVIVAAGLSSRMGDFKPTMQMGNISIIERIIANFQNADVFPIVVVTGYRSSELEKHIANMGVICVRNSNYETTQMLDSAKIGFSFIQDKCQRVFFTPVDIPLFTTYTVERIMGVTADVVKPVCNGKDGHPILISTNLLPKIIEGDSQGGLRTLLTECSNDIVPISVDDEGILKDADTPEEYKSLVEYHSKQLFRAVVDISLRQEGKLLDKSSAMLLRVIEYEGTVKKACDRIGISYSKAWKMLSAIEKNLGFEIIECKQGGEYGGNSNLTQKALDFLERYESYSEAVNRYATKIFNDYFKEIE